MRPAHCSGLGVVSQESRLPIFLLMHCAWVLGGNRQEKHSPCPVCCVHTAAVLTSLCCQAIIVYVVVNPLNRFRTRNIPGELGTCTGCAGWWCKRVTAAAAHTG